MKAEEQLAEQYLRSLGLGAVVFEPDGNIPPDFAVAETIAVEVRRLNQNYQSAAGETQGLEDLDIHLWRKFKEFLPTLGVSTSGECWYVGLNFRRPLEPWKKLCPMVQSQLGAFMLSSVRTQTTLSICDNLDLDLMRSGKDHGSFFVLGASSDDDSGGWVMHEVEKNLRLCIAHKERKIEPYRSRYGSWWLVLADHIAYSMEPDDKVMFKTQILPTISHSFQRIVLLDPRDFRRALEA